MTVAVRNTSAEIAKACEGEPAALEHLFRLVRTRGWRVSNLFHRMDGQWQANLRTKDGGLAFGFAYGPTAPDAMARALRKADQNKAVPVARKSDDDLDARDIGIMRHNPPVDATAEIDDLIG